MNQTPITMNLLEENKTTSIEDVLQKFEVVTDVSRIKDIELPEYLDWGVGRVKIPRRMRTKDVHFIMLGNGEIIRACWINRALGLLLNSQRAGLTPETVQTQLGMALHHTDQEISRLIKKDMLTSRKGPGAMSFSQANENVPEDAILISQRTYDSLCAFNRGWYRTREVMAVRYPNLGPGTTKKLRLIVNGYPPVEQKVQEVEALSPTQLGARLPILADMLKAMEQEPEWSDEGKEDTTLGLIDCFYINPRTLKDSFEGDGDGDLLYICRHTVGKPYFQPTNLLRAPGVEQPEVWEQMWNKANKLERIPLVDYLPKYLDNSILIALATWAIRWNFFEVMQLLPPGPDAMKQAWDIVGPDGIKLLEQIMDQRKGEHTQEEILRTVKYLRDVNRAIKKAQERGVWFAKVITTSQVQDPHLFLDAFQTLQQFADYISQNKTLRLSDLETN